MAFTALDVKKLREMTNGIILIVICFILVLQMYE